MVYNNVINSNVELELQFDTKNNFQRVGACMVYEANYFSRNADNLIKEKYFRFIYLNHSVELSPLC